MDYNYKGCPMFIYDGNRNYIAKTIIKEFHKTERSVSIPGEIGGLQRGVRLIIMIVHSDGISEYNGIAREVISDTREISLFKGQHKQRRANSRFTINTPATIKNVTINSNKITLSIPQQVHIANISKSGALIKSSIKCFNIGTMLEIIMPINERDTLLHAQVKREAPNEDGTYDYGCKLIYPH